MSCLCCLYEDTYLGQFAVKGGITPHFFTWLVMSLEEGVSGGLTNLNRPSDSMPSFLSIKLQIQALSCTCMRMLCCWGSHSCYEQGRTQLTGSWGRISSL